MILVAAKLWLLATHFSLLVSIFWLQNSDYFRSANDSFELVSFEFRLAAQFHTLEPDELSLILVSELNYL